jgi:lipopolysaccharide cholinephosphotransferase
MKAMELGILDAFDEYCREHGLTYWLFFGTLIGAIRHQGFIPWDDDIDIVMPYQDHRRLIDLHNQGICLQAPFRLSANALIGAVPNLTVFSRIYDDRAHLQRNYVIPSLRLDEGIWIDIFPLCGTFDDKRQKAYHQRLHFAHVMEYLSVNKFRFSNLQTNIVNRIARTIIRLCMCVPARLMGYRHWLSTFDTLLTQGPELEATGSCFVAPYAYRIFQTRDFSQTRMVPFEEKRYPIPSGFDSLLKTEYGDYMQLPPQDKQISDHDVDIVWR